MLFLPANISQALTFESQYVKTSMGAPDADLTPDQSAAAILKWVHKSLPEDGGRVVDIEVPGFAMGSRRKYTGSDLPF